MNKKVPEGWLKTTIGDVITDIADGGTPKRSDKTNFGGNIPWAVVNDITPLITTTRNTLTQKGLQQSTAKLWPKGSIILSTGATLGLVGITGVSLATKQGICGLVCDDKIILNKFLYYFLLSQKKFIASRAQGSSIKEFRPPQVKNLSILLPPLPEQEKIAEILGSVDAAIDSTRRVIEQTRRLKRALIQELLASGISKYHKKFKNTPVGRMPSDWECYRLSEILSEPIRNGYSPNPCEKNTGYWVLSLSAVTFNGYNPCGVKSVDAANEKLIGNLLKKGDLLVSRSNTKERVGLCGIYNGFPENCFYPDLLMRIRPRNSICKQEWLEELFLSSYGRNYFSRMARGTSGSMVKIDRAILENILVPLPSITEQSEIISAMTRFSERLLAEEKFLFSLLQKKHTLMSALLSGDIRVNLQQIQKEVI